MVFSKDTFKKSTFEKSVFHDPIVSFVDQIATTENITLRHGITDNSFCNLNKGKQVEMYRTVT